MFLLEFANHAKTHAIYHQTQQAYTALEMEPLFAVDATPISLMGSQQSACHAIKEVIHWMAQAHHAYSAL